MSRRATIFHDFVVKLVSNGITVGVGGGNYGVDQGTLRQQMAVFLLKGKYGLCYVPPPCSQRLPRRSLPLHLRRLDRGARRRGHHRRLRRRKLLPEQPRPAAARWPSSCSRPGTARATRPRLHRESFNDVPCPEPLAATSSSDLAAEQITGGCCGGLYCPDNSATRGQMAVFIVKTFGLQ